MVTISATSTFLNHRFLKVVKDERVWASLLSRRSPRLHAETFGTLSVPVFYESESFEPGKQGFHLYISRGGPLVHQDCYTNRGGVTRGGFVMYKSYLHDSKMMLRTRDLGRLELMSTMLYCGALKMNEVKKLYTGAKLNLTRVQGAKSPSWICDNELDIVVADYERVMYLVNHDAASADPLRLALPSENGQFQGRPHDDDHEDDEDDDEDDNGLVEEMRRQMEGLGLEGTERGRHNPRRSPAPSLVRTSTEDSNAENFYGNDYPDEERDPVYGFNDR